MKLGDDKESGFRFSKKYRHPDLDKKLNFSRFRAEIKGIYKAQQV